MEYSEADMNISALRRLDPYFERLMQNAGHVALYTFNTAGNFWEKTDIEGALFVYSRKGKPYFNILIMNRLNTKNFVEPVVEGLDLHLEDPFLLYKTLDGNIYCLWFYDKGECCKINQVLMNILKGIDERMKGKMPEREGATASGVDLFSMLTKAQEEYNSSSKTDGDKSKDSDDTPKSVKDFFKKASQGTHFHNGQQLQMPDFMGAVGPQLPMPPRGLGLLPEPLNLRPNSMPLDLLRNPLKFVENIEKRHNVTPQHELPAFFNLPQQGQTLNIDEPQTGTASVPPMNLLEAQKNLEFMSLAGAISPPIDHSAQINYNKPTSRLNKFIPTIPMMEDPAVFNAREYAQLGTDTTLMTPMMLSSRKKANKAQVVSKVEPLTKDQLLQAIHYLINNDPVFIQKIHEAYVKSFNA